MSIAARILRALGPLRVMLMIIVLLLIAAAPFAGGGGHGAALGWRFFPAVLAPVFAPIMLFVLPFDITMSRIQMQEHSGAERERYRFIVQIELVALAAMVVAWLPFVYKLVNA